MRTISFPETTVKVDGSICFSEQTISLTRRSQGKQRIAGLPFCFFGRVARVGERSLETPEWSRPNDVELVSGGAREASREATHEPDGVPALRLSTRPQPLQRLNIVLQTSTDQATPSCHAHRSSDECRPSRATCRKQSEHSRCRPDLFDEPSEAFV